MEEWYGDTDEYTEAEARMYEKAISKVNQFMKEKLEGTMSEGKPMTASDVVKNMDKSKKQAILEILESGQGLHYLGYTWYLVDGDLATTVTVFNKTDGKHDRYIFPGVTFSFFTKMSEEIDDKQIEEGMNNIALNKLNTPKTQRS